MNAQCRLGMSDADGGFSSAKVTDVTLKIGHIAYANCTPLFTALKQHFDCQSYLFEPGVPALLNGKLARGEIDASPSSSIAYASNADDYLLLPDLSISSFGPVKSVLLFSQTPIEKLDHLPIGLTSESETSVALLKILLKTFYGFSNSFTRTPLPMRDALNEFPAVLLIGDAALKGSMSGRSCYVYDLGELWFSFTGLPFVFALWIVRRETAIGKREEVAALHRALLQAKQLAYSSYDAIAAQCSEGAWMSKVDLISYWQTISYDLTPSHLEGVRTFFRHAAEIGVIERAPNISFFQCNGEG